MNKRRLTISFFVGMLATTVASLSFSFAWYATASRLNVEAIDIAVDAERDLKIATVNQEDAFVDHLRLQFSLMNGLLRARPLLRFMTNHSRGNSRASLKSMMPIMVSILKIFISIVMMTYL